MLATQNVLILNIAVADLLLIIFNMPLTLMDVSNIYWEADLTFGLVNVVKVYLFTYLFPGASLPTEGLCPVNTGHIFFFFNINDSL